MADELPSAALEEIRGREQAAAPGPWKVDVEHGYDMDSEPFTFDAIVGPDGQMVMETLADLRFAAHARTDVPRLLAAVDKVLEPHQPGRIVVFGALCSVHENHRYFSITQCEADDLVGCNACKATVWTSCAGCGPQTPISQCAVSKVIARALAGEAGHG